MSSLAGELKASAEDEDVRVWSSSSLGIACTWLEMWSLRATQALSDGSSSPQVIPMKASCKSLFFKWVLLVSSRKAACLCTLSRSKHLQTVCLFPSQN